MVVSWILFGWLNTHISNHSKSFWPRILYFSYDKNKTCALSGERQGICNLHQNQSYRMSKPFTDLPQEMCLFLFLCINIIPPQNELLSNDVTYILYYCATYKISASNLFWLLTLHPEIHVAFPVRCSHSTSMNQNARHTAVPWSDCKPLARNLILTHWWRLFNWECPSPTPPNQKHKKDKMLVENSHLCLEFEI